jgi:hypothetical protein
VAHRARWRYHEEVLDELRSVPCADCGGRFAQCSWLAEPGSDESLPRPPSAISSARTVIAFGRLNVGAPSKQPKRA